MSESLNQECHVSEDGAFSRKTFALRKIMTVLWSKRWPILVPAAAVIRVARVLLSLTGRKGCVGCVISFKSNFIWMIIRFSILLR